jgi:CheY-like chemotaxis protein
MTKRVLDVGNCMADHGSISRLLGSTFQAEVVQAHGWSDASQQLQQGRFDLVLVNRILDGDGSEGLEIIRRIKQDERLGDTPVMMITNFEEHQQRAILAGAEPGFGKQQLHAPDTTTRLGQFL